MRPGGYGSHFGKEEYDWNHTTVRPIQTAYPSSILTTIHPDKAASCKERQSVVLGQVTIALSNAYMIVYINSHIYRGKGLGGSSAVNFMLYIKPPAEEVDGTCIFCTFAPISNTYPQTSNAWATRAGIGRTSRST